MHLFDRDVDVLVTFLVACYGYRTYSMEESIAPRGVDLDNPADLFTKSFVRDPYPHFEPHP